MRVSRCGRTLCGRTLCTRLSLALSLALCAPQHPPDRGRVDVKLPGEQLHGPAVPVAGVEQLLVRMGYI